MGQGKDNRLDGLNSEEMNELINKALDDLTTEEITVQEISLNQVKAMGKALRNLDKGWVKMLAAIFGREPEYIYNIARGNIYSNTARVEFILKGNELRKELEKKYHAALHITDTISEE